MLHEMREYRVVDVDEDLTANEYEEMLNGYADQGWRLAGVLCLDPVRLALERTQALRRPYPTVPEHDTYAPVGVWAG